MNNLVYVGICLSIVIILLIFYYIKSNTINSELFNNITYKYKGYNDMIKEYNSINYTIGGIPKIIIKTSWQKKENFPKELNIVLNNTIIMNPDYNLYYFDDDDVKKFMKSYSKRAYNAYNKLIPGAYKADLFRYCILEKYGGCYSDIGHITYVSFNEICEDNKLILVKDLYNTGIHNALICTIPHNPYIINLVESCIKNIENNYYGYSSLSITGPILAGKEFCNIFITDKFELSKLYEKYDIYSVNNILFTTYIIPGVNNQNKIKILELLEIGNIETTPNDNKYIVDSNKKILIRTKFKHYYTIMYLKSQHYDTLWSEKKVYK